MRICIIGKLSTGSIVWIENLLSLGWNVELLNTHLTNHHNDYLENNLSIIPYNLYRSHKFPYGIKSLIELFCYHKGIKGARGHFYRTKRELEDYFSEHKFDLIFAWWGSDIFYELYQIIYEINLNLPIIHCLNTYPSTPLRFGYGYFEDWFYKLFHNKIAGRIFYSQEMKNFYETKIGSLNNFTLIEPYLSKCYFKDDVTAVAGKNKLVRTDGYPYIIFTGRTDFSNDFRRRKDNVKKELLEITNQNIHIYLKESDQIEESEFIHFYPGFTTEELCEGVFASYMHQFDAGLVIYNEFAVKDRYKNGLSTRFAHSLTAGIPLITRESSVFAKRIFESYKNGFTFIEIRELKPILSDKKKIQKLKAESEANIDNFSFDVKRKEFQTFLARIGSLS